MAQKTSTQSNLETKFLTLIIYKALPSQDVFCDHISTLERHEMFDRIPCSTSIFESSNELITIVCPSNFQIPFHSTPGQFNDRSCFLSQHLRNYNAQATKLANALDKTQIHCIIGPCAFVFDTNTKFTEERLNRMAKEILQ
jgi:hypothetical protein